VYQDMVDKHIIAPTVEQKTYNGTQLLERTKNNFDNTWYGDKHVVAVRNIEIERGALSESRFRFYQYDTYGNPLDLAKESDGRQSFLWDYSNTMPVAKVSNASAAEIAYTSFEADGKGNWTFSGLGFYDASAPTGNKVFDLPYTNPISRSGLTAGTYIVSYWSKSGQYAVSGSASSITGRTLSGWTYYEHKVPNPASGTITITGNGLIDELRLYPEKAQMSTYTFEPLVGMTTGCDASGRITYYQYDGYNRLVMVRDENRKILSRYCYNFADQVERCTLYSNVEKTGVFTRSNCATGYTGTSITYTVPEGLYFSNISQLDADEMADRDKIIHGPEYANMLGNCVLMCTTNNCTGDNKRCVAGVCETGIKVCTGSVPAHSGLWRTTYHYEFTDGFWSPNFEEYTSLPCEL
jgi:YD repeat-containing protein